MVDISWGWSGSKLLDTLIIFLKEFLEKVDFEKNSRQQKTKKNYPGAEGQMKENLCLLFWVACLQALY